MNDSYHSDLFELGTAPVTPGGPFRPQGCVGVETTSIDAQAQDVLFAVETVLGASTQAAEPVGVLEFDDEVVFDGTENLLPSTSGARPAKAPKLSGRGKSKKKAAAEVEESPRKY